MKGGGINEKKKPFHCSDIILFEREKMRALSKPSHKCIGSLIITYGNEDGLKRDEDGKDFLDKVKEMAKNLKSGGPVATDTLEIGRVRVHWTVNSPVRVTDNGNGSSTVTFSGPCPVEVGMTVTESQGNDGTPEHIRDYYRGMIY